MYYSDVSVPSTAASHLQQLQSKHCPASLGQEKIVHGFEVRSTALLQGPGGYAYMYGPNRALPSSKHDGP